MQQADNGRCIWEIIQQVGSDMTWGKKPQTTNKTKKARTSYTTKTEYLTRGFGYTFWWHLTISYPAANVILNTEPTWYRPTTDYNKWDQSWDRKVIKKQTCTVQMFQLIAFRISFQLMTTSEIDTSLPTPFTVTYSICEPEHAAWHRQVLFVSQQVRDCSKSYISPIAQN